MPITSGDKVHIIERRLFDGDVRRHFVGLVEDAEGRAMRVKGYTFVYDASATTYVRSATQRTRIFPIGASGLIINVIPDEVDIEMVRYDSGDRLVVTDGAAFSLDINEFGSRR